MMRSRFFFLVSMYTICAGLNPLPPTGLACPPGPNLPSFLSYCVKVTVMSAACAERCGLASRIDKRFAGRAVGVGFARILGRIHDANIR